MKWNELELHLSKPRLSTYLRRSQSDKELAKKEYLANLALSEALFPVLNVVEIAFRNGVQDAMAKGYGKRDWWNSQDVRDASVAGGAFERGSRKITEARSKVRARNEHPSADKIVSELTFGFWTSLFYAPVQNLAWANGNLHEVFPHCPTHLRQRQQISSRVVKIRDLRNRVFHHEPILWWRREGLKLCHQECIQLLAWMNPELEVWVKQFDRFPSLFHEYSSPPFPPYTLDFVDAEEKEQFRITGDPSASGPKN